MRVAFDTQVPSATIKAAEGCGHQVVYWAKDEHDEWWFREAMERGADVFVSPDWDIALMANKNGLGFIKLPRGIGKSRLVDFILNRLKVCAKVYSTQGRYPELLE